MNFKKLIIFALLAFNFSFVSQVQAANLTVTCNSTGSDSGDCVISPYSGAALFTEPDIKPGYNVPREIEIINNSPYEDCYLVMETDNEMISLRNRFGDFVNVAPVLNTVIKNSTTEFFGQSLGSWSASGYRTLQDLFNIGNVNLGVVPSLTSRTYLWAVTMEPTAGNEYQGITLEFDINFNFQCLDKPIPTPTPTPTPSPDPGKTSSMSKDGPNCENTTIYAHYDVEDNGNPVKDVEVTFSYNGNEKKSTTNSDGRANADFGYDGEGSVKAIASGYPDQSVYVEELICENPIPTPTPPVNFLNQFFGGLVAGDQTEASPVPTPTPEVAGVQDGKILGDQECCPKPCPWWWIILIAQIMILTNLYINKAKKSEKVDLLIVSMFSFVASFVLHLILHYLSIDKFGFEASPFCSYFWLLSLVSLAILNFTYLSVYSNKGK